MVLSIVAMLLAAAVACMALVFIALEAHMRWLAAIGASGALLFAILAGTSVAMAVDMLKDEREERARQQGRAEGGKEGGGDE